MRERGFCYEPPATSYQPPATSHQQGEQVERGEHRVKEATCSLSGVEVSALKVCVNQALANFATSCELRATSYELRATSKVKFHPLHPPRLRQSTIQRINKSTTLDCYWPSTPQDGSLATSHEPTATSHQQGEQVERGERRVKEAPLTERSRSERRNELRTAECRM